MKKFDKNYIKYHLLVNFLFIIAMAFWIAFAGMEEGDNETVFFDVLSVLIVIGLIIYVFSIVYAFLFVKTSGYQLKEKEIICKRGVLFKKTSVLEYKRIHAVNKKQNIFHKMFNIAVLMADSGATHKSHTAEIVVVEKSKTVDELIVKLKSLQVGNTAVLKEETTPEDTIERENLYSFTSKKALIYSALTILSSLAVILVLGALTALSFSALKLILSKVVLISYKNFFLTFLMIVLSCILLVSTLSFVISFLASFFTYYDFKVYKNENDIEVNYGLLVRRTNTFKLSKIKGVKISQGIIKRIFGYATVSLEVIGYVNENSNNNNSEEYTIGVLMPLCKVGEINENLSKILPNYVPDEKQVKSVKYPPFILWKTAFISLFSGICYLLGLAIVLTLKAYSVILPFSLILLFIYAIIVAMVMIVECFAYKNNGVAINGNKITVYNGSIVKTCTIINAKNLIGVEDITTPLRKKAGIYSYNLHIKTNALTNEIMIKNLPETVKEPLQSLVKY